MTLLLISNKISIKSFADLIERKNDNTGGHVLRTSKRGEVQGLELLKRGLFPGEHHSAHENRVDNRRQSAGSAKRQKRLRERMRLT
ncbi:MAG: hypothetical protein LBU13_08350 [Synergistaceae bacterium]|nr:hypothetical protein [Synergistaceae bacterium]